MSVPHNIKIDLKAVSAMWQMEIIGDAKDGDVDLMFPDLTKAAAFVSTHDLHEVARFTFPENVKGFNHVITITIPQYELWFKPISNDSEDGVYYITADKDGNPLE